MSDWLYGLVTTLIKHCEAQALTLMLHHPGHCGPMFISLQNVPRERSALEAYLRSLGINLETWMRPEYITWDPVLRRVVQEYCSQHPADGPEELEERFVTAALPGCV